MIYQYAFNYILQSQYLTGFIFKKMIKPKKNVSRGELLQWVNSLIPPQLPKYSRIEELGSGIGYLYILNYQYPTCLNGIKFAKKPINQYQRLNNLKSMMSIFQKMGIKQPVDINKLSKMKFQQNLNLLQWLYHKFKTGSQQQNAYKSNVINRGVIQIPNTIIINKPDNSHKMEIQSTMEEETNSWISSLSAHKCLQQIRGIVAATNQSNEKQKINKIKKLFFNTGSSSTPMSNVKAIKENSQSQIEMEIGLLGREQSLSESRLGSQSQKSVSLEDRYKNYVKSTYKAQRYSIRITEDRKQAVGYGQCGRLTDNSILLNYSPSNSQCNNSNHRRSLMSETDLLEQ